MKYLVYFFVIVLLAGVQTGLFSYFKVFGAAPDLMLLFVVGCSLQHKAEDAFFVALIAGLFADFLNGLFIGSFTLSFLLLTMLFYLAIRQLVVFELSFKYLLGVVVFSLLFTSVLVWLFSSLGVHVGWSEVTVNATVLRRLFILELIYNLIFAYPVYALATYIHHKIYARSF